MLTRIFALTLALLSVTTPARAAVLAIDDLNLNFGNGYTVVGEQGLLTNGFFYAPSTLTFSFNGTPLDITSSFGSVPDHIFLTPVNRRPCHYRPLLCRYRCVRLCLSWNLAGPRGFGF